MATIFKITKNCSGFLSLFPNGDIPENISQLIKDREWDKARQIVPSEVNKLNHIKKGDINEALVNSGELVNHMDQALKYFSKEHDIIIISGAQKIQSFLERYGVLNVIDKIYGVPSKITDDAKILIDSRPNEWGGSCSITERDFCKEQILKYHIKSTHDYVGDGLNDFCAAQSLGAKDIVCARQGKKLESVLEKESISAKVVIWDDGLDLLDKLKIY